MTLIGGQSVVGMSSVPKDGFVEVEIREVVQVQERECKRTHKPRHPLWLLFLIIAKLSLNVSYSPLISPYFSPYLWLFLKLQPSLVITYFQDPYSYEII